MSNGSGLPLQDPEDLRGMNERQLNRICASTPHGCLAGYVLPESPAPSRLPASFRYSRALYLPENGGLRQIFIGGVQKTSDFIKVLDQQESTQVLIVTGPQRDLKPCLESEDILRLNFWDRNWKSVSRQDLEKLGIVFDQPDAGLVGPDELLADVKL